MRVLKVRVQYQRATCDLIEVQVHRGVLSEQLLPVRDPDILEIVLQHLPLTIRFRQFLHTIDHNQILCLEHNRIKTSLHCRILHLHVIVDYRG